MRVVAVTAPGEAQQRAAAALRIKQGPNGDMGDLAALNTVHVLARDVLVLVERVEAAAQENKELLGGLYLMKHNLEKAEARLAAYEQWLEFTCAHGHRWISHQDSTRCPTCGTITFKAVVAVPVAEPPPAETQK